MNGTYAGGNKVQDAPGVREVTGFVSGHQHDQSQCALAEDFPHEVKTVLSGRAEQMDRDAIERQRAEIECDRGFGFADVFACGLVGVHDFGFRQALNEGGFARTDRPGDHEFQRFHG